MQTTQNSIPATRFQRYRDTMNAADHYDLSTGGVTRAVTKEVLSLYLDSDSLEGKVVLDNACGSGVVTKEILTLSDKVREIEAVDISPVMVDALQLYFSEDRTMCADRVRATVMDARELTFPDNKFDLCVTMMAIMYLSEPTKALAHLYRVTQTGGKCFITTWRRTETREMGEQVLSSLRECHNAVDKPSFQFWKPEMEDPAYLMSEMEAAGYRDCGAEEKLVYASYPGADGIDRAMELAPMLLSRFIDFRDDNEMEQYKHLWREEFKKRQTKEGLKIKMWANIVWGTK